MWHVALGSPGQCEPGWHRHQPSQPMAERGTPLSTPRPIRAAARGTPAPAGYPISCGVAATSTPVGGHCSHSVDGRCALHAQQLAQLSPPSRGSPQCRALFAATLFTTWLFSGRGPWAALCSGCARLFKMLLWPRTPQPQSPQCRAPHAALPSAHFAGCALLTEKPLRPRSSRLCSPQCRGLLTESPLWPRSSWLRSSRLRSPQCRGLLMKTPLWRRSSRPRSSWLRSPHRVAAPTALLTAALTLVPPSSWPRSPHSRLGSQCSGRGPPGGAGTGNRGLAEVSPVSRGWVVGG